MRQSLAKPETCSTPPTAHPATVTGIFRNAVVVVGALYLLAYIVTALVRIRYPFELQWIEGYSVDEMRRIMAGHGLYVYPTMSFTPYLYTPLYFYAGAVIAKLIGNDGLLPLRLLSFIASLGNCLLIFLLVRRETGRSFPAFVAMTLFTATYNLSSAWFDIARVDSLCLFFMLAAVYALRWARTIPGFMLAGALVILAFLTKQTGLVSLLPLVLYTSIRRRPHGYALVATVVLGLLALTWLGNLRTHGWFGFYVWSLAGKHPIVPIKLLTFWTQDILLFFGIAFVTAIAYLIRMCHGREKDAAWWYGVMLFGMVLGSWSARLHSGGYINVLIPTYAATAIIVGLALRRVEIWTKEVPHLARRFALPVYALCLVQFALLVWNPATRIPTRDDLAAGWKLVALMKSFPGEIYVPYHSYIPTLAGKRSNAHITVIYDIVKTHNTKLRKALNGEMNQAVRAHRFSAVIVDRRGKWPALEHYYTCVGPVFPNHHVFWPVSGIPYRPEWLYVPKHPATPSAIPADR